MLNQQNFDGTEFIRESEPVKTAAILFSQASFGEIMVVDDDLHPVGILEREAFERHRAGFRGEERLSEAFRLNLDFRIAFENEGVESMLMAAEKYVAAVDGAGCFVNLFTRKRLISDFFRGTNDTLFALLGLASMISIFSAHRVPVFDWKKEGVLTAKGRRTLDEFRAEVLSGMMGEALIGRPAELKKINFANREFLVCTTQVSGRGKITGVIGIVFDSREAFEIVQKINNLQQTIDEVNTIIETSYDGFTIADGEGVVLRVNKSHERITGSKPDNMVGRHVTKLVEDGQLDDPVTLRVLAERRTVTMKQTVRNGKQIMVTGTPVFDKNGKIVRVVCNLRDISEFQNLQDKLAQSEKKKNIYKTELEHLRRQQLQPGGIFQDSKSWSSLLNTVDSIADKDVPVLVLGETGVGKEVVAKLIHNRSRRKNAPFIKINCSAIPSHLIESELFGYEEGTFTGANKGGKIGLFEAAGGGTIFLDEIGELTPELQVKMLEVLQDNEIVRVGGRRTITVDARFVFATNRNLKQMVEDGEFREDLYFRLYVFPIFIPPLRDRINEIEPLAEYFLAKFNEKYGYEKTIHKRLMKKLAGYSWPGNVRELENYIERLVISSVADVIEESLDTDIVDASEVKATSEAKTASPDLSGTRKIEELSLKAALEETEKILIESALSKGGSMAAAAERLGVDRTTILRKIAKYKIPYNYSRTEVK